MGEWIWGPWSYGVSQTVLSWDIWKSLDAWRYRGGRLWSLSLLGGSRRPPGKNHRVFGDVQDYWSQPAISGDIVEAGGGLRAFPRRSGVVGEERDSGDLQNHRGSAWGRQGRHPPLSAGPSARQLLSRLDARPLAARAAADVAALVRRAGATLRLRPKEGVSVLDSADIEVTDSRLPHPTTVDHQPQHRRSETVGMCTQPPGVTHAKARCASKPPRTPDQFSVELVRGSEGFGLTLSGGQDVGGDAPLAVRGLLKDGQAQRCGRLQYRSLGLWQVGDLVLHINGESTQGLTHTQVVERIRAGGPQLHLVLSRPVETHSGKPEGVGRFPRGDDLSLDPGGPEKMRSRSSSTSPVQHLQSLTTGKTQDTREPSPEEMASGRLVPRPEPHTEDPEDRIPSSPGPWLVPSEERLSRALGVSGAAQVAQETAAGRRRH
ncbi:PDZ domain-containing protein MAGIX [Otolemur garnettii]|uniref:PDZ domain-containing protein MAGIX n=1 Tax=Otolemur garnettii TaxID=30611 RepID=UPI0006445744|nr:PDZ domain-containing protein MAGIX [Otolemur garnettii]